MDDQANYLLLLLLSVSSPGVLCACNSVDFILSGSTFILALAFSFKSVPSTSVTNFANASLELVNFWPKLRTYTHTHKVTTAKTTDTATDIGGPPTGGAASPASYSMRAPVAILTLATLCRHTKCRIPVRLTINYATSQRVKVTTVCGPLFALFATGALFALFTLFTLFTLAFKHFFRFVNTSFVARTPRHSQTAASTYSSQWLFSMAVLSGCSQWLCLSLGAAR